MKSVLTLSILLLVSSPVLAQGMDTIEYKGQEEYEGEISKMTYKTISFNRKVGEGQLIPQDFDSWDITHIKLGSRFNSPPRLDTGIRKFDGGDYDGAIKNLANVIKNSSNSGVARQYAYWYTVQAHYYKGDMQSAKDTIKAFRNVYGETYFLRQTYDLEYDIARNMGDAAAMTAAVNGLKNKARALGLAVWKKSAEIKEAELMEYKKDFSRALTIYGKYARDKFVGENARLGELRCLGFLKRFRDLKSKGDTIIAEAKGKKGYSKRLLMGAYNGRGDFLFDKGNTKDALLSYLRTVVEFGPQYGLTCAEHEAGIGKAAIAAARYASEQKDQQIKDKYKERAQGLVSELIGRYGKGSGWYGPATNAIKSIK